MSTIQWTDATWNPTTGCDRVSAGCDHRYGCPTHPACDPLASEAVIVYRRGNWTYRQPVGGCCVSQELGDILNSRTPVEWIRVEVPLFATKAVTA